MFTQQQYAVILGEKLTFVVNDTVLMYKNLFTMDKINQIQMH